MLFDNETQRKVVRALCLSAKRLKISHIFCSSFNQRTTPVAYFQPAVPPPLGIRNPLTAFQTVHTANQVLDKDKF